MDVLDISNVVLQINNAISKEVDDYFTNNTIDISSDTDNDIEELLETAFNLVGFKHLTNYLAYKIIQNSTSLQKTVIINKLYALNDIANKTFEKVDYRDLAFNVLRTTSSSNLTNITNGVIPAMENERYLFGKIKQFVLERRLGDIYDDTLTTNMRTVINNTRNLDKFLFNLNSNLSLDLQNIDLSGMDMSESNLYGSNLTNADLSGTNFTNSILENCNLTNANLTNTDLNGCVISNTTLTNVDLSMANLTDTVANNIFEVFLANRLPNTHVYNTDLSSIILDTSLYDFKGRAASSATVNGVQSSVIENINNNANTSNGMIEDTLQTYVYNQLLDAGADDIKKKKRRHDLIRMLLYKITSEDKFIVFEKEKLAMPAAFKKPYVKVINSNTTIDLKNDKTYDYQYGFYLPLEDGEYVKIIIKNFDLSIIITRFATVNDKGRYTLVKHSGDSILHISEFISNTYESKKYFEDDDTCIVNELDLFFGGLGEGESQGSNPYAFGDPYIYPLYGERTKLPDCNNNYRLVEGRNLYINTYVGRLSDEKRDKMEEWFYMKTGLSAKKMGFVTGGFFMRQHWVYCDGHSFFCDLDKGVMKMDEENYFSLKKLNNYEEKDGLKGGLHTSYLISWKSENYGEIWLEIKIYENPQIDNGIGINMEYGKRDCKGLLIRNYDPWLMILPELAKKKDRKLLRRLKRRKNKFITRELLGKNEVIL